MIWTTRLKRYGGLTSIAMIRAEQYRRLAKSGLGVAIGRRGDTLNMAYKHLNGHPLRVITPRASEEELGWTPTGGEPVGWQVVNDGFTCFATVKGRRQCGPIQGDKPAFFTRGGDTLCAKHGPAEILKRRGHGA